MPTAEIAQLVDVNDANHNWEDHLYTTLANISKAYHQISKDCIEDAALLGPTRGGVYRELKEYGGEGATQFTCEMASLEYLMLGHYRLNITRYNHLARPILSFQETYCCVSRGARPFPCFLTGSFLPTTLYLFTL